MSSPKPAPFHRNKPRGGLNNLELANQLCAVSLSLGQARLVHVRILGALVPHVFMAAVLERVRACLCSGTSVERRHHRAEVEAILAVLDSGAAEGDLATRAVIASSFVGDAERRDFYPELRLIMGRRLAALGKRP